MSIKVIIGDKVSNLGKQDENKFTPVHEKTLKIARAAANELQKGLLPFWEGIQVSLQIDFEEVTFLENGEPKKQQVPKFELSVELKKCSHARIKLEARYIPLQMRNTLTCSTIYTYWKKTNEINLPSRAPVYKQLSEGLFFGICQGIWFCQEELRKEVQEIHDIYLGIASHHDLIAPLIRKKEAKKKAARRKAPKKS